METSVSKDSSVSKGQIRVAGRLGDRPPSALPFLQLEFDYILSPQFDIFFCVLKFCLIE